MLNMASNTTEIIFMHIWWEIIISVCLYNGCLPAPIWLCPVLTVTPYSLLKIHVSLRLVARLIVSYVTLIGRQVRCRANDVRLSFDVCSMYIFIRMRSFGLTNPSDHCFFHSSNSIECQYISHYMDRLDRPPVGCWKNNFISNNGKFYYKERDLFYHQRQR
jgi:hypothetical protein